MPVFLFKTKGFMDDENHIRTARYLVFAHDEELANELFARYRSIIDPDFVPVEINSIVYTTENIILVEDLPPV